MLTLAGILIGLLLSLLAVWADYEASAYGFRRRAQTPFRGLVCPVFIGRNESRTVSIKISNPTDQTVSPGIWTEISSSQDAKPQIEYVQLAPGEEVTVQRTIGPENIDLGTFIFVDAFVYSAYPIPDRENTCGVLILPITSGAPILLIGTALSTLFMAVGMFRLYRRSQRSRSILFMVVATVLAMIFGFTGWWFQGVFVIVLVILTFVISAGSFFR